MLYVSFSQEKNKEARQAEDESKATLEKLNDRIQMLKNKLSLESESSRPPNDVLNELSEEMQTLDAYFTETSVTLTAYDIKKVQAAVTEIRTSYADLQDKLKPKKKFGFKGDKKKAFQKAAPVEKLEKPAPSSQESGFKISHRKNETIELNDAQISGQDVMLAELENCSIIMKSNPITLHMTHLQNCILYSGPVQTSVYMEDCNGCEFSLACQQLRAHNSINTKIYLHVTSKGIIEDCKEILVAPYNLAYEGLNDQFAQLGLNQTINNWDQLDDFNWLASDKASPNWKVLPEHERTHKSL